MSFAGDLTQEMRDIAWKYQQATSGVETQAPRWQTCLSKSVNAFGFAAAHEYVIANFDKWVQIFPWRQFTQSFIFWCEKFLYTFRCHFKDHMLSNLSIFKGVILTRLNKYQVGLKITF